LRDDLWTLVRFLHVLGAACWVGGMIVLGAVAVPAARRAGDRDAGRRVITAAARRFGVIGALAFAALIATGFGLIHHRGVAVDELGQSGYGRRILAKIGLLAAMGVVTLLHALWQGPRARRAEEAGDPVAARRWRLLGAAFDGFLLVAALAALWLAVSLVP
jgi:putative copper export protein